MRDAQGFLSGENEKEGKERGGRKEVGKRFLGTYHDVVALHLSLLLSKLFTFHF